MVKEGIKMVLGIASLISLLGMFYSGWILKSEIDTIIFGVLSLATLLDYYLIKN